MNFLRLIVLGILFIGSTPLALGDNGVERGSIDFGYTPDVPSSVQEALFVYISKNCILNDVASITPKTIVQKNLGPFRYFVKRYIIEYTITYKTIDKPDTLLAEVNHSLLPTDFANFIEVMSLDSPICSSEY